MSRLQDLPLLHPSLTLHLSDNAGTPIISSAPPLPTIPPSSPPQTAAIRPQPRSTRSVAVTSLTRTALASYTAAQRLGLGVPTRIIVECVSTYTDPDDSTSTSTSAGGPMVLNTFIPPPPPPLPPSAPAHVNGGESSSHAPPGDDDHSRPATSSSPGPATGLSSSDGSGLDGGDGGATKRPPLLVAVVVAPDGESQTVADARVAASRLARVGRRLQATWADEDEDGHGGSG